MVVSSYSRQSRKPHCLCVLPLPSSIFDSQLSTFHLRIVLSPSLDALFPKSFHQLLSHQSLPHSFLKMPGCTLLFSQKSPSIPAVSRNKNLKTEDHHERTIHPSLFHR